MELSELNDITEAHHLVGLMTDMEYRFCKAYLETFSLSHAMAGLALKPKEPPFFARPVVERYIALRKAEMRRTLVTEDDIVLGILRVIDECRQPVPVKNKLGMLTSQMECDNKTALKGYEILSKHLGLIQGDNQPVAIPTVVPVAPLSKDELSDFKTQFDAEY